MPWEEVNYAPKGSEKWEPVDYGTPKTAPKWADVKHYDTDKLTKEIDEGSFSVPRYISDYKKQSGQELSPEEINSLLPAYKHEANKPMLSGKVLKDAAEGIPAAIGSMVRGVKGFAGNAKDAYTSNDPDIKQRANAENNAAVELAITDTAGLAPSAVRNFRENPLGIRRLVTGKTGVDKMSDEELRNRLFDDVARLEQREKIKHGEGEGLVGDRKGKLDVRPDVVEDSSFPADPFNFVPAAAALKIAKGTKAAALAGKAIAKTAAIAAPIAQGSARIGGKVLRRVAGPAATVTAGLAHSAAAGAGVYVGTKLTGYALPAIEKASEVVAKNILLPATKGAAAGLAGAIPLAAMAPDEETASGILSGSMGGGALLGVAGHGKHYLTTELPGRFAEDVQRAVRDKVPDSPAYGVDKALDDQHSATLRQLKGKDPAAANLFNVLREAFRTVEVAPGENVNLEAYLVPKVQGGNAGVINRTPRVNADGSITYVLQVAQTGTALLHEPGHFLQEIQKLTGNDAAWTAALSKAFTPEQRARFAEQYSKLEPQGTLLNADGTPNDARVLDEIGAEIWSNILRGNGLQGLAPELSKRIKTTLGGLLEKSHIYRPQVSEGGVPKDYTPTQPLPQGRTPLGVGHSFEAQKVGQKFLNEQGLLGSAEPRDTPTAPTPAVPAAPTPPANTGQGPVTPPPLTPTEPKTPYDQETPRQAEPVQPGLPVDKIPERTPGQKAEDKELEKQPPKLSVDVSNPEDPSWGEAEKLVTDPTQAAALKAVRESAGGPVGVKYFSVINDEGKSPIRRVDRRIQQNAAYIKEALGEAPENIRELASKTFVPNRLVLRQRKDGSANVNVLGTSPDKMLANAVLTARAAAKNGIDLPVTTTQGKRISTEGWKQLWDAIEKYTQNHQNGYAGDGTKLKRDEAGNPLPSDLEADYPRENPTYTPQNLDPRLASFVNMLQGIEPPKSTAKMDRTKRFNARGVEIARPRNLEALKIAKENTRPIAAAKITKPGKNIFEGGEAISEFNPLRDEFAAKNIDLSEILAESVEELNLEHIILTPEKIESGVRGVSVPLATAGFMPEPTRYTTRQFGQFPKGTAVEVLGPSKFSQSETEVKFPDGTTRGFPTDWLRSSSEGKAKGTLSALLKTKGREGVDILLSEWDQSATLSPDGTSILVPSDSRNPTAKTKASIREFLEWVAENK